MPANFRGALSADDLPALRRTPKVDLHCHAFFGARRRNLEDRLQIRLDRPPAKMKGLGGMHIYAAEVLDPRLRGADFSGCARLLSNERWERG